MRCSPNSAISKIKKVAADVNEDASQANQDAITVTQDGAEVKVAVNGTLNAFASTNPAQGTGEWIGFEVATGAADLTKVTFDGVALTAADVAEADSLGLPQGSFVLWTKAEELPRTFAVGVDGKEVVYTIKLA